MSKLIKNIKKELLNGKNVALIGPPGSGKSKFVKNGIINALISSGEIKIDYLKDCNQKLLTNSAVDIRIVDEFETFVDMIHLEKCHPEESPYYKDEYVEEVTRWHKELKHVQEPTLYIITRNDNSDINYLVKNLKSLDWGTKVKSYKFSRLDTPNI